MPRNIVADNHFANLTFYCLAKKINAMGENFIIPYDSLRSNFFNKIFNERLLLHVLIKS